MPTLGRYVDLLDMENNLMYPKTAAAQVIYEPGKTTRRKIKELEREIEEVRAIEQEIIDARDDGDKIYITLDDRLDSMTKGINNLEVEINASRVKDGINYPTLADRLNKTDEELDAVEKELEDAKAGYNSLSEKLNAVTDGNNLTLEEVIKARDGEVNLDTRLDKMQTIITEANTELTKAKVDDMGINHPTLQVRLDRMRQDAARTDSEVIEARTRSKYPDQPFDTLQHRLDAMEVEIANAVGGNFLPIEGGHLTGDVTTDENLYFNNNKGIALQSTQGRVHWALYMDTNNEIVIGADNARPLIRSNTQTPQALIGGIRRDIITSKGGDIINGDLTVGRIIAHGNNKNGMVGTGATDIYLHNSLSNKYLQLKDDGTLQYDNNLVYHRGNFNPDSKLDKLHPVSNNWWRGVVQVNGDGVSEVGKYLDFHNSNTGTSDFNARITCDGGTLTTSGAFTSGGNLGTSGQIWVQDRRVAAKASHGGLDLGNTNVHTTIQSSDVPTWWNGSTDRRIITLETNNRSTYIGDKMRLGTGSNNDIFIVNQNAGIYLSMKDDGTMTYGGKQVVTFNSASNTHNQIRYGSGLSGQSGFITFTW